MLDSQLEKATTHKHNRHTGLTNVEIAH